MKKDYIFPRKQAGQPPKLSDFKLLCNLGSGSYGDVFKYLHIQSGQQYAIKVISTKNHTKKDLQMLKKQIQNLYKIESDFVVKLVDHFEAQETVYLITQYIKGKDLHKSVFQKKVFLQYDAIAKIAYQMCLALEQFKSHNLIHRDLKLQNVIFCQKKIKIVDLGCSNSFGQGKNRITAIGTKPYWCPQLLKGENQDDRLDVWCLGVIIYQLVFLHSPFGGNDMFAKIKTLKYEINQQVEKKQPQLCDFIRKILVFKKDRPHASQLKNHKFLKKYLGNAVMNTSNFEDFFDLKIVNEYKNQLLGQIQRYREMIKSLKDENTDIQKMINENQIQISKLQRQIQKEDKNKNKSKNSNNKNKSPNSKN